MGEKFGTNPVTGTASMNVPIVTSPGRSGFGPTLALSYDSGAGNGAFGFGWRLSVPLITRKTDKGLPRFDDDNESDVFILSDAEDLVPTLIRDGACWRGDPLERTVDGITYRVQRYRPRVEGLFSRIERWTNNASCESHWRTISRENVTTVYGRTVESRIADPAAPTHTFTWLPCESYDDKGNALRFEYKGEDAAGIDCGCAHERHRTSEHWAANRYLKRIRYGNRTPCPRGKAAAVSDWMFEVVLDYGEHAGESPVPQESTPWAVRRDAFSSYRAGFEIRTSRLCQRVLMFHHFPDEPEVGPECLVSATAFTYRDDPVASFVVAVTRAGYRRTPSGYVLRALPPLEFEYSRAVVHPEVRELDRTSVANLPYGLDGQTYQWVDLDGEGLSGILTEQGGSWFYKPNRGGGRFGATTVVAEQPSLAALRSGTQQLLDLAGDGQLDLVTLSGAVRGFFERTAEGTWAPFRTFPSLPAIRWDDPNLRFVDLDGDGHADVLITEDDVLRWYPSLGEDGFDTARRVAMAGDEDHGVRLAFADGSQSIYLADMSGDGLTDLVRVRNGEICYWPNTGYGRFAAKVTMSGAPWLDEFDQRRVRLADIDGSGNTDLIYLGAAGVELYFNQSGNSWSAPHRLPGFPAIDQQAKVTTVDLLGNGTACLVWSSPLPSAASSPLRYVDLMGGQKPHLLVRMTNNLGAETVVRYATSTAFYLADRAAERPWITRLPFPVHVVERVETYDNISRNRFVSRYAYHHGFYDGVEREFRGFGMVEQTDTEEFSTLSAIADIAPDDNIDAASHVPPVLTKSWFHTGAHPSLMLTRHARENGTNAHLREYFHEPGRDYSDDRVDRLPDSTIPSDLLPDEEREAFRALRGAMLRQEVYALDGTSKADLPYRTSEHNFTIRRVQPRAQNRYAVFFSHPRETLTYHYERNPRDPRIQHIVTLDVDEYGDVLAEAAVAYGRRRATVDRVMTPDDHDSQARIVMTCARNRFSNAVLTPDDHRTPLVSETRLYELTGIEPANGDSRFTFQELASSEGFDSVTEIAYEQQPGAGRREKRLIEHTRTLYRKDDLTALLPLGVIETLALPGENYKLALTPGLLRTVFYRTRQDQDDECLLPDPGSVLEERGPAGGGYVRTDDRWWIPSGRLFFDVTADVTDPASTAATELRTAQEHFYLPRRTCDAFGRAASADYDGFDLLLARSTDVLGNTITALNDYRVLQPRLVTDPNGNRTHVNFDAIGMAVATAVMGKVGEALGDLLEDVEVDLTPEALQAFTSDPLPRAAALLGKATTRVVYDLHRYRRAAQPPFAATLSRETHFCEAGHEDSRIQVSFSFSNGFGTAIQQKVQAEPGPAPARREAVLDTSGEVRPGNLLRTADGGLRATYTPTRWVGSGRTVFNNKGQPVHQYEPFFSATHLYESERELTDTGSSATFFYDPVGRVVATLHADDTFEKVVFNAWQQAAYDLNDTVAPRGSQTGDPRSDADVAGFVRRYFEARTTPWQTWYAQRIHNQMGEAERDAATKAAAHADTPTVAHFDVLGRIFLTVAQNRLVQDNTAIEQSVATRLVIDVEGNQRRVMDAKGRVVAHYDYDMLGNCIHSSSMDAGERWLLNDVTGKQIRVWDSRGFLRRMAYDELRRLTHVYVSEHRVERLVTRFVFGEQLGEERNHRTRVHQVFDLAGVVTSLAYDFKGNLLEGRRDLLPARESPVDWTQSLSASDGSFTSRTGFDALNRPRTTTSPDGSVFRPGFNEANLLDRLDVHLGGAADSTPFVANIDYDAKGQRQRIVYGNGAQTVYEYDPLTFRLTRLRTSRPRQPDALASQLFADPAVVQDLRFTYDPIGNLTRIEDASLRTVFHDGQRVDCVASYRYDALYRLVEARGREHIGQTRFASPSHARDRRDYPFEGAGAHPNDSLALRRYVERYEYDAVGNFDRIRHVAHASSWTREYEYADESLIEPGTSGNRLTSATLGHWAGGRDRFSHDAHGNITAMSHLAAMAWSFDDRLESADLGGGGYGVYVYDAGGERVSKTIHSHNGKRRTRRVYIGSFESYREYDENDEVVLERESLHVMDDKQRIAIVETQTIDAGTAIGAPAPVLRYQLGNHLASVCVELDGDGALVSFEDYYPYGATAFQAGRSATEVSQRRYRYTAQERDDETGFYYHGARYFAPWLGRWTSCDPAGMVDGTNLFAYGRANPILHRDSTGTNCDPTTQSCVDQTQPTPREEALQQSLPEDERNLPPPMALDLASVSSTQESSSSGTPSSLSLSVSTTQYLYARSVAPVDVSGQRLRGTYYLWSGDVNKNAAKAMISQEGGWLMSQTPQHVAAADQFAAALRREAGVVFPGRTFTNQQLFSMAGTQISLPQAEMRAIWDPPSADVARRAVLGGLPVQGNLVTPPGSGTVQARIELPEVSRGGLVMGGLQVGAGALNVYGGLQQDNDVLAALGVGGGSLQIAGGTTWAVGAYRASAPLMSTGSRLSVVGAVVTAPITLTHAYGEITSGDQYLEMKGTMRAVGVVAPPAAFLTAYQEVFVEPAARTFAEAATAWVCSMVPCW